MKSWQMVALGVLIGLLASGLILLVASAPRGEPVRLLPADTPAPLVIDVSGAVQRPGVYRLLPGARVTDALDAAGGLTADAQREVLNLAAPLSDGQRLIVPASTDPLPADDPAAASVTPAAGLVNVNTATLEELMTLPGIGPGRGQDILDYRAVHGPFRSLEQVMDVPGIGEATFAQFKERITLED